MHLRAVANRDFPQYGAQSPAAARFPRPISHHCDERLSNNLYSLARETVAAPANSLSSAERARFPVSTAAQPLKALYTPEQRLRRDATKWTLVQGILAPIQFAVFLVSLVLVIALSRDRRRISGRDGVDRPQDGFALRDHGHRLDLGAGSFRLLSVCAGLLLGRRLQFSGAGAAHGLSGRAVRRLRRRRAQQMLLALAAYASYFVNATQFILKLRAARRDERIASSVASPIAGAAA